MRQRGEIDGITYKRARGQAKLHDRQERWNQLVSKLRAKVEHPLGMMKQQFGYRRVRYRGLERNAFDFCVTLIAARPTLDQETSRELINEASEQNE